MLNLYAFVNMKGIDNSDNDNSNNKNDNNNDNNNDAIKARQRAAQ